MDCRQQKRTALSLSISSVHTHRHILCVYTYTCRYVGIRIKKAINRYFRFISGEKITLKDFRRERFSKNLSILRIAMLHFCSGSLAQKPRDLMHSRAVYLAVCWVSLFAAKKHLMSRSLHGTWSACVSRTRAGNRLRSSGRFTMA